jgi:hypothetical protein
MDREMFTVASKFSDKLSAFPNKDEGYCFPSDTSARNYRPSFRENKHKTLVFYD